MENEERSSKSEDKIKDENGEIGAGASSSVLIGETER